MNNNIINNNNNNNNSEYNNKLYNSVFNNIYLKKIILNHLTKFNILFINIGFQTLEEWEQFKYKEYLNSITLGFSNYNFNQFPNNIKHIALHEIPENYNEIISTLPKQIDTFNILKEFEYSELKKQSSSTTTISKCRKLNISIIDEFDFSLIPKSISNLRITGQIDNESLPELNANGSLLEELTDVSIIYTPSPFINLFSSNSLVRLEIDIEYSIDSDIMFPNSLQELIIICYSFNSKLPDNLKSLVLSVSSYEDEIKYPLSLEFIDLLVADEFNVFDQQLPSSLKKFYCTNILNKDSILPNNLVCLETLKLNAFNQIIQANQLPSSLTYLELGYPFNQVIDIDVLPKSLETLILGHFFTQIINPLAIPKRLKLLKINNPFYSQQIKITPSTHPNTAISCHNLNLYYSPLDDSIRVLRLPNNFVSPLSTLQLQNKSSLEYLHMGRFFNQPIQQSDLPVNNNIKTLVLSYDFKQTINLEYFQNLETIIINSQDSKITTTIIMPTNVDQQLKKEYNDNSIYNNYNLKDIIVPQQGNQLFLKNLDINFYKFLKYNEINE